MKKALSVFVLFCIFTFAVAFTDVQAIGPEASRVGLARLNAFAKDSLPCNGIFYTLSEIFGYMAVAVMMCFAAAGTFQLFKRKKLLSVDREILFMGILYICLAVVYVFFDKVLIVNYSPRLFSGELKASYPSSHTMLAVAVFGSASVFASRKGNTGVKIITMICAGLTVVFRMFGGVHWFTDIVGGLLSGACLLFMYKGLLDMGKEQ